MTGTPERPRLAVFRSLKHIYAQIIDDADGRTLAAASTMDTDLKGQLKTGGDLGAPNLKHPPAIRGTYSAASSGGGGGGGGSEADGPMSAPED